MKYFLAFSLLLCLLLPVFGQTGKSDSRKSPKLDSLWAVYKDATRADTLRIEAIEKIAFKYLKNNADSAILILKQEVDFAKEKKLRLKYAGALKILGVAYSKISKTAQAFENLQQALTIYEKEKDKLGMADCDINFANIYSDLSDYPKSLQFNLKAMALYQQVNNNQGVAKCDNSMGVLYNSMGDHVKALDYFQKALVIITEYKNNVQIGICLTNIGNEYRRLLKYTLAKEYHTRALKMFEESSFLQGVSANYINLGNDYYDQNDFQKAMDFQFKALQSFRKMGNKLGMGNCFMNISEDYGKLNNLKLSIRYGDSAIAINKAIGDLSQESESYKYLAQAYAKSDKYKEAYENYMQFSSLKDSIFNTDKTKQLSDLKTQYEVDKKETELKAKSEADHARQRAIIYAGAAVLLIVIFFSIFLYRRFKITQQQKVIIEQKSILVEEKQKEIVDSINYARRLQQAILPSFSEIQNHFPDSFILYHPKDIVAGDFYWMYVTSDSVFIAAADCTGHGVPGALVSVVCSNALNRTVNEFGLRDTGRILDKVTELVLETFEKSGDEIKDGMDISLLCLSKKDNKAQWSGANTPLWIIKRNELTEIKADKQPIGKSEERKPFSTIDLSLTSGDTIYLITDGYSDQFGHTNKKLMKKKFKEILLSIQDKSMSQQKYFLDQQHNNWKGKMEQTDDVTVIGIKI